MGVQLWNYTLCSLIVVSLQDRKQPDVCDKFFHDVPFEAHFATDIPELQSMTAMPGVDGFTMKVDALYKVCGTTCMSSVSYAPPLSCCMSSQTENFLSAVNITLKWNIISVISTTSLS